MSTYYTLLNVDPEASQQQIDAAYDQQRKRYNPERFASIDEDIRQKAEQRIAELEQAYQVLSDPQQRQDYNASIGYDASSQHTDTPKPRPTRNRERWYMIGGAIVGLILVGVIWMSTGQTRSGGHAAPEVNRPAPDFRLPSPDGAEIQLDDYAGNIVMVNFWGTWCQPCIHELPELQTAYEQLHSEGFVIIGVNLFHNEKAQDKTRADIHQFIEQHGITYPVALDEQGDVSKAYQIYPIPTSFFIDADGNIRYVIPSELTAERITELFTSLKQEAGNRSEGVRVYYSLQ
jgi:peroxiredoxin